MPTAPTRRPWFPLVCLLSVALVCPAPTRAEDAPAVDRLVGTRVGDFRLENVVTGDETWFYGLAMGNRIFGQLLGMRKVNAAVLVFVSPGCPLGDKYLPRLGELAKEYQSKGVLFFGVASGAGETADELKTWVAERQVTIPILHDEGNKLADALMVERSNEAILVDLRGTLRYRGAIDDQHGYDGSLPEPRHTWLVDAIDATLDGQPKRIDPRATPVQGCRLTKVAPEKSKLAGLDRVRPANTEIATWLDENDPAPPIAGPVTWTSDVAGILQTKCQACHRPGQVGGFSLLTYDDAFAHSAMLGEVVENRRMPPWHADPRHGHFANDRRLSAADRAKLLQWVADGAPRGEGEEPTPRQFPEGWSIGIPDLVFEIPEPTTVPAQGTMPYVNVAVPTNFKEDMWVQAAEAVPGNHGVVHHIIATPPVTCRASIRKAPQSGSPPAARSASRSTTPPTVWPPPTARKSA